ncbi:MAG: hydantoinase B/oxoprolinase family protein, partial [Chloroflexi bacterium]|nr:hydantoinase B/oxoprolinase family protein [Chloroflexota bacterium]
AGRQRGGLGIRRVYELTEGDAQLTTMQEREIIQPYGLFGGEPGRSTKIEVVSSTGERQPVRAKATRPVKAGDVMIFETAGGGGYGSPAERSPEDHARDELLGYL